MAGMAYFLDLRKLGAGIVRTGSGLPGLEWESIDRFKPEFLVAVPSFLLKMIDFAKKTELIIKTLRLKLRFVLASLSEILILALIL
jgi:phenylacetate-CoA ligase